MTTLSYAALADIGPKDGSCSVFTVLFVAAAVIVMVQLVRRKARPTQSDDTGTGSGQ